jgi:hypothetical protein
MLVLIVFKISLTELSGPNNFRNFVVLHSSFMVFKFALWVTEINLELDWLGPSD